jgi:hypothetical protein
MKNSPDVRLLMDHITQMLKVVDMSLVNEGFFESYCPTFMELL